MRTKNEQAIALLENENLLADEMPHWSFEYKQGYKTAIGASGKVFWTHSSVKHQVLDVNMPEVLDEYDCPDCKGQGTIKP